MTRAELAVEVVLGIEGGWSDHKADRGGKTNFGITEAVARKHGFDVSNLTRDQVRAIFIADYWSFDWLKSDAVAQKLFDIAVNSGPGFAAKALQKALAILGRDILQDGFLGPATKIAANQERPEGLVAALAFVQMQNYVDITRRDESQLVFIRGWLIRGLKTYL